MNRNIVEDSSNPTNKVITLFNELLAFYARRQPPFDFDKIKGEIGKYNFSSLFNLTVDEISEFAALKSENTDITGIWLICYFAAYIGYEDRDKFSPAIYRISDHVFHRLDLKSKPANKESILQFAAMGRPSYELLNRILKLPDSVFNSLNFNSNFGIPPFGTSTALAQDGKPELLKRIMQLPDHVFYDLNINVLLDGLFLGDSRWRLLTDDQIIRVLSFPAIAIQEINFLDAWQFDLTIQKDTAYITDNSAQRIIDISDPKNPQIKAISPYLHWMRFDSLLKMIKEKSTLKEAVSHFYTKLSARQLNLWQVYFEQIENKSDCPSWLKELHNFLWELANNKNLTEEFCNQQFSFCISKIEHESVRNYCLFALAENVPFPELKIKAYLNVTIKSFDLYTQSRYALANHYYTAYMNNFVDRLSELRKAVVFSLESISHNSPIEHEDFAKNIIKTSLKTTSQSMENTKFFQDQKKIEWVDETIQLLKQPLLSELDRHKVITDTLLRIKDELYTNKIDNLEQENKQVTEKMAALEQRLAAQEQQIKLLLESVKQLTEKNVSSSENNPTQLGL